MNADPVTVRELRLSSILKKWQDGGPLSFFKTLPKQDLIDSGIPRDDLEENGLISSKNRTEPKSVPSHCGQREMARILTEMFGQEVFTEQIRRSLKDGAPGWNRKGAKLSTRQFIKWWGENKAKSSDQVAQGAAADAQRKLIALEREKIELARSQRELDAAWIHKPDAQMTVTAAILEYHAIAKKALDRDFARLVLERIGDLDEPTKTKIQSAVTEAGRMVVAEIEKHARR